MLIAKIVIVSSVSSGSESKRGGFAFFESIERVNWKRDVLVAVLDILTVLIWVFIATPSNLFYLSVPWIATAVTAWIAVIIIQSYLHEKYGTLHQNIISSSSSSKSLDFALARIWEEFEMRHKKE